MNETASLESDQISEGLATGYTNRDFEGNQHGTDFAFHNTLMSPPKGTAAGGGCSTAADLLRFVTAITQRKIVNQDSEEFLRSRIGASAKPSNYVFHNGGAPGQGVWMQSDVSNGYSIIVLSNYGYPAASTVVRKISKSFELPIFN